ncbi:MAG TPA: CDP-alcohol phosphatidyltransferase family protein [Solirubrobacteraceae bacterium]|nr:CDP-alcohol phosphatidyltransferase family protein [Solirubrobacteraceae bacterium]
MSKRRVRLTRRRLLGLDRSGPPPPETLAGAPLNPLTVPNAIVAVRGLLIPVFLVLAYNTAHGHSVAAAVLYGALAWSDYADGIAARVLRQYSRLGALLDPLVDRLLVVAGLAVCWSYELLPRWALGVLLARELLMVVLARPALKRGVELRINWPGRAGIWWTLSAPFWALLSLHTLALISLYLGMAMTFVATALYIREGLAQMRASKAPPRPSS